MEQADRVRENTAQQINESIDRDINAKVREYAMRPAEEITRRIGELDREWDIERLLEANASVLALAGLLLGARVDRRWLILPGIVLPFLFQHSIQGWCPPMPVLRRLGVRTRQEIDREKYALKVLRGDFSGMGERPDPERAIQSAAA